MRAVELRKHGQRLELLVRILTMRLDRRIDLAVGQSARMTSNRRTGDKGDAAHFHLDTPARSRGRAIHSLAAGASEGDLMGWTAPRSITASRATMVA
jgi:hypothetical protein